MGASLVCAIDLGAGTFQDWFVDSDPTGVLVGENGAIARGPVAGAPWVCAGGTSWTSLTVPASGGGAPVSATRVRSVDFAAGTYEDWLVDANPNDELAAAEGAIARGPASDAPWLGIGGTGWGPATSEAAGGGDPVGATCIRDVVLDGLRYQDWFVDADPDGAVDAVEGAIARGPAAGSPWVCRGGTSWASVVAAPTVHVIDVLIDHTQVPSALTNYPLLVDITHPSLRTVANGGSVTNVNGYDIVPMLAGVLMAFDRELYDGVAGRIVMWVLDPSILVSPSTVGDFEVDFGDAAITTDQQNKAATWAGYMAVWHLQDAVPFDSTVPAHDATGNGNNWRSTGGVNIPTVAAEILNGLDLSAGTGGPMSLGSAPVGGPAAGAPALTLSCWMNAPSGASYQGVLGIGANSPGQRATIMTVASSNQLWADMCVVGAYCAFAGWNALHHVAITWPNAATAANAQIYIDGAPQAMVVGGAGALNLPVVASQDVAGGYLPGAFGFTAYYSHGQIDECRIKPAQRSAAEILADYRSQRAGQTFTAYVFV